jgi:hypothetical protein
LHLQITTIKVNIQTPYRTCVANQDNGHKSP